MSKLSSQEQAPPPSIMVNYYDTISDDLRDWALQQQVFFIASAPLAGKHVNLSPKGLPASTLKILDPNHVAYIDATGSGIETISHVYENGRATIMFCSFDKSPRIMRWFCRNGKVVEWDSEEFGPLLKEMGKEKIIGARAVIVLEVFKGTIVSTSRMSRECPERSLTAAVQTSCGYAVPRVSSSIDPARVHEGPRAYLQDRETLGHWAGQQVEKGTLHAYHQKMNARSLDGCAGLRAARRANREVMLLEDGMIWLRRTLRQRDAVVLGVVLGLLTVVLLRLTTELFGLKVPNSIRLLA